MQGESYSWGAALTAGAAGELRWRLCANGTTLAIQNGIYPARCIKPVLGSVSEMAFDLWNGQMKEIMN